MAGNTKNPPSVGYSGTPLAKKLGVKPGHRLSLIDAPGGFEQKLVGLPEDAAVLRGLRGKAGFDVILLFCSNHRDLMQNFSRASERLTQAGGLWIAWPKKASGVSTDLSENAIRQFGLDAGLVDNKVCAIDETWSGLRFVIRLRDRK